jgi:hypothetical protein
MSTFRPRGRAYSPPTWAWYEQLDPEDLESDRSYSDVSDSEDERDSDDERDLPTDEQADRMDTETTDVVCPPTPISVGESTTSTPVPVPGAHVHSGLDEADVDTMDQDKDQATSARLTSEMKGKHRAVDSLSLPNTTGTLAPPGGDSDTSPSSTPRKTRHTHRRKQPSLSNARPILTIKSSQGFVWNQVCLTPPFLC